MGVANDRLRDFELARQIDLLRLSESETRELRRLLDDADVALETRLRRVRDPGSMTAARIRRLREQITGVINSQHAALSPALRRALRVVGREERDAQVAALTRVTLPLELEVATANATQIGALIRDRPFEGATLAEWTGQFRRSDLDRTWRTVRQGIAFGQTTDEIVRAVVGTTRLRRVDGVREISRRGLRSLVRTSTIHAADAARSLVFAANADLLSGVQWVATLDLRICPTCIALDGRVFELGEGVRPPVHLNDRCVTVPVLRSASALGATDLPPARRAAFDGQVSGSLTAQEWLRGRSARAQDRVLGRTFGRLFRDGNLDVRRFLASDLDPLTVDAMRRRVPGLFDDLGL